MDYSSQFSSAAGTNGKVIAARIHPNLDLLETIENICKKHDIQYGQLTSTIGSLRKVSFNYVTTVEPAEGEGYTTAKSMEGPFSLLTGQGLVSPSDESDKMNIHYHAVISGENNVILGGHILPGTITLTTTDLFIMEVKNIEMTRDRDPETGAVVTTIHQA